MFHNLQSQEKQYKTERQNKSSQREKNYTSFKAIGGKKIIVLNCPTELYKYDNPDEHRLPFDTEQIDYNWELKMG